MPLSGILSLFLFYRSLLGASKRYDRPLEGRLKSGRKYNDLYATLMYGDRFIIDHKSVMSEDIYVLDQTPRSGGSSAQNLQTSPMRPQTNTSEPSPVERPQVPPEPRASTSSSAGPVVPDGYYDAEAPPSFLSEEAEALIAQYLALGYK